jgi:hypothetical protein
VLPYAVALGLEKPWSNAFAAWLATAAGAAAAASYSPHWYHGDRFHAGNIGSGLGGVADSISSSMTNAAPAPSSSSSGFSGGGGGPVAVAAVAVAVAGNARNLPVARLHLHVMNAFPQPLNPDAQRAHEWRNSLHTWLIIAGSALLMGIIAWLIFGASGVIWAVLLSGFGLWQASRVSPKDGAEALQGPRPHRAAKCRNCTRSCVS